MRKKPLIERMDDPKNHTANICELIDPDKPVHVYKNLTSNIWSVKQGTVKLHTDYICLKDVQYRVQPAGRERVRRENKKYVHAYVVGKVCEPSNVPMGGHTAVYYNPHKVDTFVSAETGDPVYTSEYADLMIGVRNQVIAIPELSTYQLLNQSKG